jgi:hypothetical protein
MQMLKNRNSAQEGSLICLNQDAGFWLEDPLTNFNFPTCENFKSGEKFILLANNKGIDKRGFILYCPKTNKKYYARIDRFFRVFSCL